MAQRWLKQHNPNNLIRVRGGAGNYEVLAPLPESFGFTVGSEYSAPFDVSLPSGILQKGLALGGISQKLGIRMRKMYSNPEPTEISFEMEFAAYYSAAEEVVIPVVQLALMSLGRSIDVDQLNSDAKTLWNKIKGKTSDIVGSVSNFSIGGDEAQDTGENEGITDEDTASILQNLADVAEIIEGPPPQTIHFGNIYTMPNAYITSISPQFSNVLDKAGYPMSAKVSITCTLERYPVSEDIIDWFNYDSQSGDL